MIYLKKEIPDGTVALWFTEGEEEGVPASVRGERGTGGLFYRRGELWDCSGDIAMALLTKKEKLNSADKRIVIRLCPREKFESKFYSREALIRLFSRLNGWKVMVKYREETEMKEEHFFIECPKFSGVVEEEEAARRDYAHPVDTEMIGFLDNSMINLLFRRIVSVMSDSTYGTLVAGAVPINEKTYPEINEIVNECVEKLRIKRPYTVISGEVPGFNAAAFGSDEEPYIVISPLLVKALSKNRLKFVIGHECGHIAMGHLLYHSVLNMANVFASSVPVIGPMAAAVGAYPLKAWARRSELSADRAGLLCCGDYETAKKTLMQLALPFLDADKIDAAEYINSADRYLGNGMIRRFTELDEAHPIIPKRIRALREFTVSRKYYRARGLEPPMEAISDKELEMRIENIVKVL